jgi:SWIB/MDM2 domain-containing protein/bifunctional DNA primase/polymerase-like protein
VTSADTEAALDAALTLGADGLFCFPCLINKRPATPHGFKQAQRDWGGLRELWRQYPAPLIGVATGAASDFDVLDIDPKTTWSGMPVRPHMDNRGAASAKQQPWRKSMPIKTSEKKSSERSENALRKPLQPSEELAAVIGSRRLSRGQAVSKIWDYIRSHNLQNPENRREILADDKLRKVFGKDKLRKVFGKDKVTIFEMNKHLAQHLR